MEPHPLLSSLAPDGRVLPTSTVRTNVAGE